MWNMQALLLERSRALWLYFHNQNHLGPSSPVTRQKMVIHQVRERGREEELRDEGIKAGIQESGMELSPQDTK